MNATLKQMKKLILKNEQEIRIINVDELLAVTVTDYLCKFEIENSKDFICSKSLSEVEKLLPENFIRINRNAIINSYKIVGFNKKSRKISLTNNSEYNVSIRNLDKIILTFTN
jgi:DNA-binding LytR/AlgR family response regulator